MQSERSYPPSKNLVDYMGEVESDNKIPNPDRELKRSESNSANIWDRVTLPKS